jgi:hypothetical protein
MAPSRDVLIFIELFKLYYQKATSEEYISSPHDTNILLGLPFLKDSDFWHGKRLYRTLIDKYFSEPRGIYSIDNMIIAWRRGLLKIDADLRIAEEIEHPFEYGPYKFIPRSKYNDKKFMNLIKNHRSRQNPIDIVYYFTRLRNKFYEGSDAVYHWIVEKDDNPLASISLFQGDGDGYLIFFRDCKVRELLKPIFLIRREAYDYLGFDNIKSIVLIPNKHTEVVGSISPEKDISKLKIIHNAKDYIVAESSINKENFLLTNEQILNLDPDSFRMINLMLGKVIN